MILRLGKISSLIALGVFYWGQSGLLKAQQDLPSEVLAYADLILYNGKILTADDDFTTAEAVAVRDGKFLAVGESDRIRRMAGPQTRQVDLDGRSVVPGLWDPHLHQAWIGQVLKTGSWRLKLTHLDSGLEEIQTIVDQAPAGEWLFLSGPYNKVLINELNRQHLDPISPHNPVVIVTGCNVGVANALALEAVPPETGWDCQGPGDGGTDRIDLGICSGGAGL